MEATKWGRKIRSLVEVLARRGREGKAEKRWDFEGNAAKWCWDWELIINLCLGKKDKLQFLSEDERIMDEEERHGLAPPNTATASIFFLFLPRGLDSYIYAKGTPETTLIFRKISFTSQTSEKYHSTISFHGKLVMRKKLLLIPNLIITSIL